MNWKFAASVYELFGPHINRCKLFCLLPGLFTSFRHLSNAFQKIRRIVLCFIQRTNKSFVRHISVCDGAIGADIGPSELNISSRARKTTCSLHGHERKSKEWFVRVPRPLGWSQCAVLPSYDVAAQPINIMMAYVHSPCIILAVVDYYYDSHFQCTSKYINKHKIYTLGSNSTNSESHYGCLKWPNGHPAPRCVCVCALLHYLKRNKRTNTKRPNKTRNPKK